MGRQHEGLEFDESVLAVEERGGGRRNVETSSMLP